MSTCTPRLACRAWIGLVALAAAGCSLLPPDLQRAPVYLYELATNDNSVVNTPVLHEIFGYARGVPDEATRHDRLRLAPGFRLSVYASGIPHPRMIRVTNSGDLIVSQPRKGRVLLLTRDADGDGRADGQRVLVGGLDLPHGIELAGDTLFIAEPHAISRVRFDVERGEIRGDLELFIELPQTNHHQMRTLRQGPDGWLYYPIGANCNLCEAQSDREAALLRVRPDGSGEEIHATGFRNIAGFDWKPDTNELYANDIGADYQGEDFPPEELNRIEAGAFYGFPYSHGDRLPDPEFGPGNQDRIDATTPPALTFPAHTTPLGMIFLRGDAYPEGYASAALMAFHGSWNKRQKVGYKIISLHWQPDGSIETRDFLAGFELDEDVIGRPVDVAEGPDGSIYISDDYAGAIYRVSVIREGEAPTTRAAASTPALHSNPSNPPDAPTASGVDAAVLARSGQRLFEEHACGGCHDASSASRPHVPLQNLATRYGRRELVALLATPPPAMPRAELAAAEREALAAYLLSRAAPSID